MHFNELKIDKEILKILDLNNLNTLTEIQKKSIPVILSGSDVIGISQTGTGKTISFLVPIINNLLKINKSMYCLIVVPTRELAVQINTSIKMFSSLSVRSLVLIGGEKIEEQKNKLKSHPHIIIGTPGRLFKLKDSLFLNRFRVLVLDEADKFFEEDFKQEIKYIFDNFRKKRQMLFFTATFTDNMENEVSKVCKNLKKINLVSKHNLNHLDEYYVFIARRFKESWIYIFLEEKKNFKILVFVNMKSTSVFLSTLLKNLNVDNAYLNGDQDQKEREFILNEFIKSKFNVLITTDIGSRGIDVVDIDLVINYDVPQTHKDYIHRVGRTARAGKTGLAITIVTQYDIPQFQKIEYMINKKLECYIFDKKYKHLADKVDDLKSKIKEEVKMDKYNK